jgi:conjugal transfer pilus assembly protein TraD
MLIPWVCFGFMTLQSAVKCLDLIGRGKLGEMLTFLDVDKLLKLSKPERMWFGWGFDWTPIHTQRAVDYMLSGVKMSHDQEHPGSPWIHGLNMGKENEVLIPLKSLEGHTIMFGTTGAGKTRAYEVMVTQAIHRGDTVIMIDPKGDKELRDRMELECKRAGRDRSFLFFHPAFPRSSIRLDPMRNFTRTTEIASRIAALLPSQTGGSDAFTAFAFRALNLVAQGLLEKGKRPSIKQLRYFIEGGAESLLVDAIECHANRVDPDWKISAEPFFAKAKAGKAKKMETITNPDWLAIIEWYRTTWSNGPKGSEGIDGLLSLVEHNRMHFSKMIASLIPVLNMLTSGELGDLLSPDEEDDPDGDGQGNMLEFALGGNPANAADHAILHTRIADSEDSDSAEELLLTLAVRVGTPAFAGSPAPPATLAGITYTDEGGGSLEDFSAPVLEIAPVISDLPAPPSGYEYRTFSLDRLSNPQGFLRVRVSGAS